MAPLRLGRMTSGVLLPIAPIAPIADRVEYPVSVPVPRCNRMRSLIIPPVSRAIPRMDRVFPVVVSLSQDNDWKRCLFVKCHPKTGMSILVYCTIILTSRALPDLVTLIVLVPVHRGKLQLCSRTRTRSVTAPAPALFPRTPRAYLFSAILSQTRRFVGVCGSSVCASLSKKPPHNTKAYLDPIDRSGAQDTPADKSGHTVSSAGMGNGKWEMGTAALPCAPVCDNYSSLCAPFFFTPSPEQMCHRCVNALLFS